MTGAECCCWMSQIGGGVPGLRGYVARQSGIVSSVLMSPSFMCVLLVTNFRTN